MQTYINKQMQTQTDISKYIQMHINTHTHTHTHTQHTHTHKWTKLSSWFNIDYIIFCFMAYQPLQVI